MNAIKRTEYNMRHCKAEDFDSEDMKKSYATYAKLGMFGLCVENAQNLKMMNTFSDI